MKIDAKSYEVFNVSFDFALKKLQGKQFDVIFADPPYALKLEEKVLELVLKYDVLKPNGVIVVEHDTSNRFSIPDAFACDEREMGNTTVSFLTYERG